MLRDPTDKSALLKLLVECAPLVRERIRSRRRGAPTLPSTSDIFSSIAVRICEDADLASEIPDLERTGARDGHGDGAAGPAAGVDGAAPSATGGVWPLLEWIIARRIDDARRRTARLRNRMRRLLEGGAATAGGPESEQGADRAAEDREVASRLQTFLAELDPEDHRIAMQRLNGASWRAVARSVGLTEVAARKRFQRLMAGYRARLETPGTVGETRGETPPETRHDTAHETAHETPDAAPRAGR